jgi:PKD repeat protein
MEIVTRLRARAAVAALAAAVAFAGCSLEEATLPTVTAPSEFALSVVLSATPDALPRDGSSQAVVTVTVRNAQGRPVCCQRVILGVSPATATLSETDAVTDASGRLSVAVTAPPANSVGNSLVVSATPVGTGAESAVARVLSINLTGPSNSTAPTADFTNTPTGPVIQENVVFDASTSVDEGVVCLDRCTYSWDFGGEATRTGRIVTYQFQTIRTYPVKLTVTDAAGASGSKTTNVAVGQGTAPTAAFTFSPTSPAIRQTINFTAEASRPGVAGRTITTYAWRFGNGSTASGVTTTHSYSVLGTYPVVLTVTDSAGVQTTASQNVTIVEGVTAAFTSTSLTGRVVIFNAESSLGSDNGFGSRNPIVNYIWHFGDTTSLEETTSPRISHTFPNAQAFTVTLTVVDSAGRRRTTNSSVTATN